MAELASLLPLVGIALLFWLLIIRPAQRRQKDQRAMQNALSVGERVVLTSGIFGTIRSLSEERAEVEISPNVVISVARAAVGGLDAGEAP